MIDARAVVVPTDRPDLPNCNCTPPDMPTFHDVPADYWSYKLVEHLAAEDIVLGYPDGSYRPEEVVTRDQMAVYVAKAFRLLD